MKNLIIGLLIIGFTNQIYAQDPTVQKLPEVTVVTTNYKYLNSTDSEDVAIPVEELEMKASNFDLKELDIYQEEYDFYDVYFVIPEGRILASYDKDGNILSTAEKFNDIDLPIPVLMAVAKRFPNWSISKNVYVVNYRKPEKVKKLYKITLKNGDQNIRIKLDDRGNFL